jgi:Tol biopolymer transport system component
VSSRDGNAELYRGGQRLTAFHRDDWQPTPSPDGTTLAFLSDREGPSRIFLMSPDGTSLRRLTERIDDVDEGEPAWSRDGGRLAYVASGQVYVRDLASGTERAISGGAEPAFSPDGNWLAIARTRGSDSDVVAIPLAGGAPQLVARSARLPRWL